MNCPQEWKTRRIQKLIKHVSGVQTIIISTFNAKTNIATMSKHLAFIIIGSAMIYSSRELLNATDNFSQERIVGKGGFGVVYRARLRMCDIAVKQLTEVCI